MKAHSMGIRIIVGIVFVICIVGGVLAFQSKYNNNTNIKNINYPTNAKGQTYGSSEQSASFEELPDLILAGFLDGTPGYLLKKTYIGDRRRIVPVYDVDGETVIGSYPLNAMNQNLTKADPNYPKNKNGQTYGSATDAISPDEPDLVSAIGVNGKKGYVLKKDLDEELPKSPEEAIAIQNSRPPGGRYIPLYDVDGETIIDTFHVSY